VTGGVTALVTVEDFSSKLSSMVPGTVAALHQGAPTAGQMTLMKSLPLAKQ